MLVAPKPLSPACPPRTQPRPVPATSACFCFVCGSGKEGPCDGRREVGLRRGGRSSWLRHAASGEIVRRGSEREFLCQKAPVMR